MSFVWKRQEELIWDWDLNPREKDESHVRAIASHMNEHGYDPKYPIIVYKFEGAEEIYYAATGHHRLEASLLKDDEFPNLPLSEVFVEIIEGTHSEYVRRMLTDNFQHVPGFNRGIGKIPSATELHKMRKGVMFFPDIFEKGDRLLAKTFGCDRSKVSHYRDMIIKEVQLADYQPPDHVTKTDIVQIKVIIESDLYIGKDGKKYPRTSQAKPQEEKQSTPTAAPKRFYAQIIHDNKDDAPYSHTNGLYFPSKEDREEFGKEFAAYHDSHDHDGEAPEFRIVKSTELSVGYREQAKKMIIDDDEGWRTDYDGWFRPELSSKIRYFKPTCIIQESPAPEESQDKELDADLKEKLTDIFTLHGSIPIYNPLTQKSYSEELAEDSDLSAAEVYLQINQFKTYIHELEKEIKKSLKKDPSWEYDSLACAMNLMQKDAGIVKTIMANIASRQEFDKQNSPPQPEPIEETPAYIDTMEVAVPKASETNIQKIHSMTIYVENSDPSQSYPEAVHFYDEKSRYVENHPISDIPSDVLAELERVVNKKLQ